MMDISDEECRLEGGPADLPEELRNARVHADALTVEVPVHNGWQHFERDGDFTETGTPIFRWTRCTKVAE